MVQPYQGVIFMTIMKRQSTLFEKLDSTSFDDEVLAFWGERAQIELCAMGAIAACLD
jgi:hypothetical protein